MYMKFILLINVKMLKKYSLTSHSFKVRKHFTSFYHITFNVKLKSYYGKVELSMETFL